MNRRHMLAASGRFGLGFALFPSLVTRQFAHADDASTESALPPPRAMPSADQIAWQDLELGMFIHFAPNTWQDAESDNLTTPLSAINPKELDTDQWARTAVELGAKYIVFVAKHQGGFCMWQTQTTDYGIRNTPWRDGRGDVLADISGSCRKHGLKLGVYLSPRDDHFGARTGGVCGTPELQSRYNAMYREQLTEVLSRYGEMVEIWFDGSTAAPIGDVLHRYQPHAMIFQGPQATIRWVGNEDGFAPYPCWNSIDRGEAKTGTATSLDSDPDGDVWLPNEVDVSIRRPDWFWSTKNTDKVLSVDQLLSIYYRSVGRGAQLLLNIPANREGLLSHPDCTSARSFDAEIQRRFAKPIAAASGSGPEVLLKLDPGAKIDTVILEEETAKGERVRGYRIEAHAGGAWHAIAEGSSIGHKRIQPVDTIGADSLRVVITKYAGVPTLRRVAVFHAGGAPPPDWNMASQIWAPNLVGHWTGNQFSVDLTSKIHAAKQYRLRFVPREASIRAITNVVLKLHGVEETNFVKPVSGNPAELILDITGVAETVELRGQVVGASSGDILLQEL